MTYDTIQMNETKFCQFSFFSCFSSLSSLFLYVSSSFFFLLFISYFFSQRYTFVDPTSTLDFIWQAIVTFLFYFVLCTTIMIDLSPESQIYATYKCGISYYSFHYFFLCRIFPFCLWNRKFITSIKEISK